MRTATQHYSYWLRQCQKEPSVLYRGNRTNDTIGKTINMKCTV
jgi:hypothetical protein